AENQAASAQAGAKEVGELAMTFAERNIAVFVRIRPKAVAGQGAERRDGAALGLRKYPSRGAHRTSQGTEQTRDQNVWATNPALI
ncbi:MAG: hypothetical protein WB390_09445, partial [Pseudolabrys sp.]